MVSATCLARRESIQASSGVAATGAPGSKPSMFMRAKRQAFQILVTKARACSVRGLDSKAPVFLSKVASKRTSWL